jgi:glycosyltransferase involved in cell wall biosynthesis
LLDLQARSLKRKIHMTPNLVSCYCPTYGRVHCLEEAVESFLKQDYKGPKELVILNDYENQTIRFDHPDIKVYNTPYRIKPLGAKFNATVKMCSGDVLFCWEDDDIYLPNRISYTLANMKNGIFHTGDGFFENAVNNIKPASNVFHATHAFTKTLFDAIGGYPEKDQCDVDVKIMEKFREAVGGHYSVKVPVEDRFYIYRWSTVNSYHGSGWGPQKTDVSLAVESIVESQRTRKIIPSGEIVLKPRWSYDYMSSVKSF